MFEVSTKNAQFAIFTVCNIAYLPKALVLAESLQKFKHPKLKIYLFDRKTDKVDLEQFYSIAQFVWIEDIGYEGLEQLAFKYDITEFSTSLKPWIALDLLKFSEKVVFLDPDTCLFSSLDRLSELLDEKEIILTPHYITPEPASDLGMMRFGSFNLGFFAVRKTPEAIRFLEWWSDRCLESCCFETQFGLSTDQKWVTIAPCFFPTLYISFDLGYNVAFWNMHERVIDAAEETGYVVNGKYALVFFHFSAFDEKNPQFLSKRPFSTKTKGRKDYMPLVLTYKEALDGYKDKVPNVAYSFDYMSNGDYISPTFRRAYASVLPELPVNHDPFDSSGVVARFGSKNYLLRNNGSYKSTGFGDLKDNRVKLRVINTGLKLALRIFGPNRMMNFSRLFVFLSSFRMNRDMWKL